jgi:hypothetical protein
MYVCVVLCVFICLSALVCECMCVRAEDNQPMGLGCVCVYRSGLVFECMCAWDVCVCVCV